MTITATQALIFFSSNTPGINTLAGYDGTIAAIYTFSSFSAITRDAISANIIKMNGNAAASEIV